MPDTGEPPDWLKTPLVSLPALSIRQPWAWCIVRGWKDIENRSWSTRFRGPILIHASKGMTHEEYEDCRYFYWRKIPWGMPGPVEDIPDFEDLARGGIVGTATIHDCVQTHDSPWFVGENGFVLRKIQELDFFPCRGSLGFFHPSELKNLTNPPKLPSRLPQ